MVILKLIALLFLWILWSIACAFALCFAAIAATLEALSYKLFPQWERHLPIARQASQTQKQSVRLMLDPSAVKTAIEQNKKLSPLVDRLLKKHLDLE